MRRTSLMTVAILALHVPSAGAAIKVIEVGANRQHNANTAQHTQTSNANEALMIERLEVIIEELRGHYGWGQQTNGRADRQQRRFAPSTLQGAITGYGRGGAGHDEYRQSEGRQNALYPRYAREDYVPGRGNKRMATQREEFELAVGALEAMAEGAYRHLERIKGNIETLTLAIEGTLDQKEIADLTARKAAEIAFIAVIEAQLTAAWARADAAQMRTYTEANKAVGDLLGAGRSQNTPALGSSTPTSTPAPPAPGPIECTQPPCLPPPCPGCPTKTYSQMIQRPSTVPYGVRFGRP